MKPRDGLMLPWFSILLPEPETLPVVPGLVDVRFMPTEKFMLRPDEILGRNGRPGIVPLEAAKGTPNYAQVDIWTAWPDDRPVALAERLSWGGLIGIEQAPPSQCGRFARNDLFFPDERIRLSAVAARPLGLLREPRFVQASLSSTYRPGATPVSSSEPP